MTRSQLLTLLGAGALVGSGILAYQLDPGPGGERRTYRATAYVDCLLAKADAGATPVDCVEGPVAVAIEASSDTPLDGYEIIPGTETTIATKELATPKPLPLVSDCIAGELRRDVSARGDGSKWWYPETKYDGQCERSRLQCRLPDKRWVSVAEGITAGACIVIAGHELGGRPTWQDRLREHRPETATVEAEVVGP